MSARTSRVWVLGLLLLLGCDRGLEAENARLEGELGELRRECQATQSRLEEIEAENQSMLERLTALGANVDDLSEHRATLLAQLEAARAREQARLDVLRRLLGGLREMIAAGRLRVRILRGQMVVELPESVLFDSGSAELKEAGKETLTQVAKVLTEIPNRSFLVAGHTDNVRIKTRRFLPFKMTTPEGQPAASNWELSAARGVVVLRFLRANGVPASRLGAAGFADRHPVATNRNRRGRAKNRRIEIILQPNLDELPDLSALEAELRSAGESDAEGEGEAAPETDDSD